MRLRRTAQHQSAQATDTWPLKVKDAYPLPSTANQRDNVPVIPRVCDGPRSQAVMEPQLRRETTDDIVIKTAITKAGRVESKSL